MADGRAYVFGFASNDMLSDGTVSAPEDDEDTAKERTNKEKKQTPKYETRQSRSIARHRTCATTSSSVRALCGPYAARETINYIVSCTCDA